MRTPYYTPASLDPNKSVGFLIKRCGVLMTQLAERAFGTEPITFTQWMVLMRVGSQAHMSATQLSEELGHDMGALTRVVDTLERRGLLQRERSARDRRAVEIAITAAGRRQAESGKREVVELLNEVVQPFSEQEVDTLIALLQRMMGHLQSAGPAVVAAHRARRPARHAVSGGKA
jgi:DNA-binding MarR family transcriptional regulator